MANIFTCLLFSWLVFFVFFPYNKSMIKVEKKVLLKPFTTLKIGSTADFFTLVQTETELREALKWARAKQQKIFILGAGSNILLTKPFRGLVIKNEIKGWRIIKKTPTFALVEATSGEAWSHLVNFTVQNNLFGLENLFLIPGTIGAAPVQNIGAYGVELKDVFVSLRALDLKTGREKIFSAVACRFGYRDSIFKNKYHGRYFILSIICKLSLRPQFKLAYGTIREELKAAGVKKPTAGDMIRIISKLRSSKLPNLALLPNAGSFFKNPVILESQFKKLQFRFPEIKSFPDQPNKVKIPAAWLIEQAGFKGKKFGSVGMYEKQALVLVNYGGATANEALKLVSRIQTVVKKKFGIKLEPEVNII
ncbi:MAG: UDP-N-acetylmuramate dehydrogenase [Candidatus Falkowbacteria bacterium]|nr:UDP-N-acetylmuramate dehydrogenase [Candidatus Falkowbacteria bacterium]